MSKSRQTLGRWGEDVAARHLTGSGFTILDHNVRTPYGELDLVAWLPASPPENNPGEGLLVFIEIKTRTSPSLGFPEISITPRKQAHLMDAARFYIQEHPEYSANWRIDVVAIQRYDRLAPPTITHFENIIT